MTSVRTVASPDTMSRIRRLGTFTTGDVAKLLNIAPRTVSKWIDSGRLHGYRIPGSHGRRVPREALLRFMREHSFPTTALSTGTVLLVGLDAQLASRIVVGLPDGMPCHAAASAFAAGLLIRELGPAVVVIDLASGRSEGTCMAREVKGLAELASAFLIAIACEDETDEAGLLAAGFAEVFRRPFDPELLVECIRMVEDRQCQP